jgi:hypothetical protein
VKIFSNLRNLYIANSCFVGVALALGSWAPGSPWHLWRIGVDPVSTGGHVVNMDCNHHRVQYSFVVDGVSHQGSDNLGDGIYCRTVKIGQPVAVYYEKDVPENNFGFYPPETPGNPARAAFLGQVEAAGAFLLLGPLFMYWLSADRPLPRPAFLAWFWTKFVGK